MTQGSFVDSFSTDKKTNSDTFKESLSCDLHPVTSNILHCCKELFLLSNVYSRSIELAVFDI